MKVKDLIAALRKVDGDKTVYLETESKIYDFTGVTYDDNNEVSLYVAAGDKEA